MRVTVGTGELGHRAPRLQPTSSAPRPIDRASSGTAPHGRDGPVELVLCAALRCGDTVRDMRRPTSRVLLPVFMIAAVALSGCTSQPATSPSTSVTSSPTASASATPTPTPTVETAEYGAFTRDQLIDSCIRLESEMVNAGYLALHTEQTRIERRQVAPEWFVYIPAVNENGDVAMVCVLGGTPDQVEMMTVGGTLPLTEDEVQTYLESNSRFEP